MCFPAGNNGAIRDAGSNQRVRYFGCPAALGKCQKPHSAGRFCYFGVSCVNAGAISVKVLMPPPQICLHGTF
jgi:hypothetical protein